MKSALLFVVFSSLLCLPVSAQDSKPAAQAAAKIGSREAANHYEQEMIVTGKVAQVTMREKVVFLNIDENFPNAPFTAVVFSSATNKFGDLPGLKGKDVEIQGKIVKYRDSPEMVLSNSAQLKVVGKSAEK